MRERTRIGERAGRGTHDHEQEDELRSAPPQRVISSEEIAMINSLGCEFGGGGGGGDDGSSSGAAATAAADGHSRR